MKINKRLKIIRGQNSDDQETTTLEFYAAVYDQESKPFGFEGENITEIMREGCFDNVLKNTDQLNTIATLFHDKTKILGRSTAGTLSIKSDDYGLLCTVNMGNTQLHKDTIEQIERGDLFECSFIATTSDFTYTKVENRKIRTINSIDSLIDVSIVDNGQYSNTIINMKVEETEPIEKVEKPVIESTEPKPEEKEVEKIKNEVDEPTPEVVEDEPVIEPTPEPLKKEVEPTEEPVKETDELEIKNNQKSKTNTKTMDYLDLVRSINTPQGGQITLERAGETTTSTSTNVIPQAVGDLSIQGNEPIWEKLKADFYANAEGTITLPYKSPAIAEKCAELASVTKDTISPLGNMLTGERYQYSFELSYEALAQAGDSYLQKLIVDGQKGAYRKFEQEIYRKLVAGATEIADGDVSVEGFAALESAVDSDGEAVFVSPRSTFFKAKAVSVDAGSGVFLAKKTSNNTGETNDGTEMIFSNNFKSDAGTEYVICGDMANGLAIADYNKTIVINDPYTLSDQGLVKLTVVILMGAALKNPTVIAKSPDLDQA